MIEKGSLRKKQRALATLATTPGSEADELLLTQIERFKSGTLPNSLILDLFEAAAKREDPRVKAAVVEREQELAKPGDPLRQWRDCLEGGRAEEGRIAFNQAANALCIRCHAVHGKGGAIGPDLGDVRTYTDRIFILESIVDPNAVIVLGFQNVMLTLQNDEIVTGILKAETDDELTLVSTVDGKKFKVPTANVKERAVLPSAMPNGLGQVLGKRMLRDIVEYLATLD